MSTNKSNITATDATVQIPGEPQFPFVTVERSIVSNCNGLETETGWHILCHL